MAKQPPHTRKPWLLDPIVGEVPASKPWLKDPIAGAPATSTPGRALESHARGAQGLASYVGDVARNVVTGVAKGAANIVALPRNIVESVESLGGPYEQVRDRRRAMGFPASEQSLGTRMDIAGFPSQQEADRAAESIVPGGEFYEPETGAGRLGQRAVEFGFAGGTTKAGTLMSAAAGAVAEALKETGLEKHEATGAFLTPLVLGLVRSTAGAILPKRAARMAADAIKRDKVTPQDMAAATKIIKDARALGGAAPTFGQALSQATNGRANSLLHIEDIVEKSTGGGPVLSRHFAELEEQLGQVVQRGTEPISGSGKPATGRRTLPAGTVATDTKRASATLQRGAETAFRRERGARTGGASALIESQANQLVNQQHVVDAFYDAIAASDGMPAATVKTLEQFGDDLFLPRGGPRTPPQLKTRLGDLDALHKHWSDRASPPGIGVVESAEQTAARKDIERLILPILDRLRNRIATDFPDYGRGLREFELGIAGMPATRQGPIGALAQAEPRLAEQMAAVWRPDTTPEEITNFIRRMGNQPGTTARFVRDGIRHIFDQAAATDRWRSGNFLSSFTVRQRDQLEAAIKALPNGAQRWEGFNTFVTVMEAYARRISKGQLAGSDFGGTQREFGRGRFPIPFRAFTKAQVWLDDMIRFGNTRIFAEMVTDPQFSKKIMRLVNAPVNRRADLVISILNSYIDMEAAEDRAAARGQ